VLRQGSRDEILAEAARVETGVGKPAGAPAAE